jgi:hypothetical protein
MDLPDIFVRYLSIAGMLLLVSALHLVHKFSKYGNYRLVRTAEAMAPVVAVVAILEIVTAASIHYRLSSLLAMFLLSLLGASTISWIRDMLTKPDRQTFSS